MEKHRCININPKPSLVSVINIKAINYIRLIKYFFEVYNQYYAIEQIPLLQLVSINFLLLILV